ncbi:uncharacterized protein LOC122054905 [Zingiber officinale]|uniref:uncharacterized protein LOC122054905 n=1 Tax=Zingiber officinale TaxID=94328 RepID=UPI001C4D5E2E|nr:uncharacterized protein LOC122054905 [Zingiber officinale]
MAESSPSRDSKKGKAIVLLEEPRVESDEQVPFCLRVLEEKLAKGYKPSAIGEYDDSKEPEDHLRKSQNATLLHQYNDSIKCRVFLNTLFGSTQKWFDGLPNGSITCFHDFKTVFLRHFTSSRKYQKTDHCLFALKQGSAEPLQSYIKCFNQVAQDVPSATSEILMSDFSHGLVDGEFFQDLIRDPVKNFDEMLGKATSYFNVEEAQTARRKADKAPTPAKKPEKRLPQRTTQPLLRARTPDHPLVPVRILDRFHVWQLFKPQGLGHGDRTTALTIAELGLPPPEIVPRTQQRILISQQAGVGAGQPSRPQLDNAGQGNKQSGHNQEPGEARDEENRGNAVIHEIGMISGRPIDGDSARARKSHERRLEIHAVGCSREQAIGPIISFGPQDLEGLELPHDDAMIIKAVIANNRVARVFMDTGSSVNVLFKSAF